jgi:hypothetical protein
VKKTTLDRRSFLSALVAAPAVVAGMLPGDEMQRLLAGYLRDTRKSDEAIGCSLVFEATGVEERVIDGEAMILIRACELVSFHIVEHPVDPNCFVRAS